MKKVFNIQQSAQKIQTNALIPTKAPVEQQISTTQQTQPIPEPIKEDVILEEVIYIPSALQTTPVDEIEILSESTMPVEEFKKIEKVKIANNEIPQSQISVIEKVEDEKLDAYTEESVKTFEEALANAKEALANGTQEEVDAAEKALVDAYNALEEKPEETIPEKDDDSEEEGSTGGSDTGDSTNVGGLLAMMIVALGVLVSRRKRA